MTIVAPLYSYLEHDRNARMLLNSLKAGKMPEDYYDCGKWNPIVAVAIESFQKAKNKGPIVEALLNSLIKSNKYPGLAELLSSADPVEAPRQEEMTPTSLRLVEQPPAEPQNDKFPTLSEIAKLPVELSAGACQWLDEYVSYSKQVSPEGYVDFHEACGLWLLSTIAGRRIKIPFARKQYTPLMIVMVARTSLYAKSNTAEAAINVLQAAGLRWLLGSDETTPQKLMSDMAGQLPKNYETLGADQQYYLQKKIAMSAQRGWFYDEFGGLIKAMSKQGGVMQDFKGLLLKLDNCADSYEYSTQTRGAELIEKPYLSFLGTATPSDFRSNAKAGHDFWSDGFNARLAFVVPPPDTSIDAPFTLGETPVPWMLQKQLRDWHERLGYPTVSVEPRKDGKGKVTGHDVVKSELPETECVFGEGVYDSWKRYRSALKKITKDLPTQDLDGSYNRLSIKAIRIAALFASLENEGIILMKHFALAQSIAERWRRSLHELYSQVNRVLDETTFAKRIENDVVRTVKHLIEKGEKAPTIRDMSRYMTRVDVARIKMACTDLVRVGLLSEDKTGKSPRYSIVEET